MPGSINFSGLSSGIDTASIVESLVKVARQPIARAQREQTTLQKQKTVLQQIQTELAALATAARGLDTSAEFAAYAAESSDAKVVSVAAGGGAQPGQYQIEVMQLASAQKTYSDTFAAKDQAGLFDTGTLSITAGADATVDIVVDGSMTLEDVAAAINASDARVNASVFFDGSNYRLAVSGQSSGAAETVSFGESGVAFGLATPANTVQDALDAIVQVDGASGFTVTRPSNVINDLVQGVTVRLHQVSADPITVDVSASPTDMVESIKGLVNAYNKVMGTIDASSAYKGTADTSGFVGDSLLRSLRRDLQTRFTGMIAGVSSGVRSLSEIGITTGEDGKLAVNEAKLSGALTDDPAAVERIFVSDASAGRVGLAELAANMVDNYVSFSDGRIAIRDRSLTERLTSLGKEITRVEDRVANYEAQLLRQFNTLESTMASLQAQGNFLSTQFYK